MTIKQNGGIFGRSPTFKDVTAETFTGDLNGDITGDITGDLTGNVTGNLTGDVTGDVTGNLTGDVTGNLTGDVTGDVTGDLFGNFGTIGLQSHIVSLVDLTDATDTTAFTFNVPAITNASGHVSIGFEFQYVLSTVRYSSTRRKGATFGRIYGAIGRMEGQAPDESLDDTDKALSQIAVTPPTITWSSSVSGDDVTYTINVDNPYTSSINTRLVGRLFWYASTRNINTNPSVS